MADGMAELREAARAWKAALGAELAATWPLRPGVCPGCGGGTAAGGAFKRISPESERWVCFSSGHGAEGPGREKTNKGGSAWTGDALDLAAHAAGMSTAQFLRSEGYLTDKPLSDAERREIARRKADRERKAAERARHRRQLTRAGISRLLSARWTGSALDWSAELVVTAFRPAPETGLATAQNTAGRERVTSWGKLADWLAKPSPVPAVPPWAEDRFNSPKSWLPGWTASRFHGQKRSGEAVVDSGALLIDLDSDPTATGKQRGDPELGPDALRALLASVVPDVAYLAHTSPSSRPGAWRWRVVLPLSRRVNPDEYAEVAAAVRLSAIRAGSPALEADPGWCSPSRFFYGPAAFPDYFHLRADGRTLDPDAILRAADV